MQAEKFAELKPYIVIEPRPTSPKILAEKKSSKKDTVLELNSADTIELQYIRGIGSYYAKQIVRYRQQLGGYYKVEQLREIMELEDSAYTVMRQYSDLQYIYGQGIGNPPQNIAEATNM